MIENFPSNSHKAEREKTEIVPEERKVDRVVTGKVVRRKKTLGRRLMDTFFSTDSNSVIGYLVRDVIIPAGQAMLTDLVTQGIQKAVYGEVRSSQRGYRPTSPARTHVSYDRFAPTARATPTTPRERRSVRPNVFQMGEVILEHRVEADRVLERLDELIQQYGAVSVADLNSLVGQTSEYTDHKFGWDNIDGAEIRVIREGFLLVLPEPEDLR